MPGSAERIGGKGGIKKDEHPPSAEIWLVDTHIQVIVFRVGVLEARSSLSRS